MKTFVRSLGAAVLFLVIGMSTSQAQTYSTVQTWNFESGLQSWYGAGAYQSGTAPYVADTAVSFAHGGAKCAVVEKGDSCWQPNLQFDSPSMVSLHDSLSFWVYPTVGDTTHTSEYQLYWQDNNWSGWNGKLIPVSDLKANQWNLVGIKFDSINTAVLRIGIQAIPKATHADSTALDTFYVDDITLSAPINPATVTQWGVTADGFGKGWPMVQYSASAADSGNASIGGTSDTMAVGSNGADLVGGFDTLTATTSKAVVVSGQLQFVGGAPGAEYTPVRFALMYSDSVSLMYQYTDTASWVGPYNRYYGYEFTPRSGSSHVLQPNGGGGDGSVWGVQNGEWPSTYGNGGGVIGPVVNQAPIGASMTAGTYNWAISVMQINDTTNQVSWYMVKSDNSYWFGGTVDAPAMTEKFNHVGFWIKGGTETQFAVSGVMAQMGNPITVPTAPFSSFYISEWGVTGDGFGKGWPITNDSSTVIGNAAIAGTSDTMAVGSNGADLVGGFGQSFDIPTDKAIIVTGQVKFVGGAPGVDYTPIRFAIFNSDSITLQNQYTDSASWVGPDNRYFGYEFTPRSGDHSVQPNGGGGDGSVWGVNNGEWASTYGNGGGVIGSVVDPAPPNASMATGTYNWAISVQQINDTTNQVRWYLIAANNSYWIGGMTNAPAFTHKFNAIGFWIKGGTETEFDVQNAEVNMGNPISIPRAPWTNYYILTNDWGFYGGRTGGWGLRSPITGNASIGGNALTGPVAVRAGFYAPASPINGKDSTLVVTGDVQFVGGGFKTGDFRLGLYNSMDPGTVQVDTSADTSQVWSGADSANSGYLFIPMSGSGGPMTWYGNTSGSWGGVVNGVWDSTNSGYVLGDGVLKPAGATAGAGTYSFEISIAPTSNGAQDVGFEIADSANPGKYSFGQTTVDDHSPITTQFNSIILGLAKVSGVTAMNVSNVQVTMAAPPTVTGVENGSGAGVPKAFALDQNYPNPFNPSTVIQYALPKASHVVLKVYDVLGREVATLVNGNQAAGTYKVNFNMDKFASGVYFVRLIAGSFVHVEKMMLLK